MGKSEVLVYKALIEKLLDERREEPVTSRPPAEAGGRC